MPILFSDAFRRVIANDKLVYVDAGARGGPEGPWADVENDRMHVVAFEPDPDGARDLQGREGMSVVPAALWSGEGTISVHIAKVAGTSSVHPPNWELLKRYPPRHYEPRTTVKTIQVPCMTLDMALADLSLQPDFLKIDTQGAEFEILTGATKALQESVFGVVVETWTTQVHKRQHLTGEVMMLMNRLGFGLFDFNVGAAWHRSGVDRVAHPSKREIVGLDLLFLREPTAVRDRFSNGAKAAKAAAIADLYGVPDIALEILDMALPKSAAEADLLSCLRRSVLEDTGAKAALLHY